MLSKIEIILIVFLSIILIVYLSFVGYMMYSMYLKSKNKSEESSSEIVSEKKEPEKIDITSSFQTDFFNKSAEHAENVLFNKIFIHEYGDPNYYGNKLMDVIYKLNDETKRSIIIAIKYLSIEPGNARMNEQLYRMMADQERVPLWFIILRESTKKAVPELMSEPFYINKDNIVPLFQKTG